MSCNPSNPGSTHHAGCACHEAAWQARLDMATDNARRAIEANVGLGSALTEAYVELGASTARVAALESVIREMAEAFPVYAQELNGACAWANAHGYAVSAAVVPFIEARDRAFAMVKVEKPAGDAESDLKERRQRT